MGKEQGQISAQTLNAGSVRVVFGKGQALKPPIPGQVENKKRHMRGCKDDNSDEEVQRLLD